MNSWRYTLGAWIVIIGFLAAMAKMTVNAIVYEVDNYPRKPQQEVAWQR